MSLKLKVACINIMETNNSEYIKMMSLKPNILLENLTKFHSEISLFIWTSTNTFRKKILLKRVIILSWLWSIIHQNLIKDLFWNGCRYVESRISLIQTLCKKLFLSYPSVYDWAGQWNTAMNDALCITYHVTTLSHMSCNFYCFPLFPRPSESVAAINVIVTSWFLLRYTQRYRST